MNTCPAPEELRRLLEEDGPDAHAFEAHLEGCADCLRAVEALVADGPVPARDPLVTTVVARAGFVRRPARFSAGVGTPTATASSSEGPLPQVAGYEVFGELGRGGMGAVYRARHVQLDRVVALKMILAGGHAGEDEKRRFLNEAAAIARVRHPGIVEVYDYGTHEGLPYLSLEYCEGGSLAERLAGTPLPAREAAALTEQLARAMQAAHDAGVVHRDLKPSNVLLASAGRKPPVLAPETRDVHPSLAEVVPKITDFGLAKRVEGDGLTQTGAIVGTPSYMPPEQAQGSKAVGPLADGYALGTILYECLTGRPPFKAATLFETLAQVVSDEPVAVRQLQAKVPADLETICHKCLQKDPARRYASAQALAEDLQRFQQGRPILARPVGRAERLWRWGKREPLAAGLLAAVLVALALGATVSGALAVRADRKATEAEQNATTARDEATRADKERNIAVAVNEFLRTDLLGQADLHNQPFSGGKADRNPNITVVELLDRAAKAIEGKFKDQPETEASIRRTIGNAYRALGKHELARPQLERSLAGREQTLGADHPETLTSMHDLAVLYKEEGKYDKAEPLYLEILLQRKQQLGADHPDTLTCKHSLAVLYHVQGKYDKAEPLTLEVLQQWEQQLGPDDPRILNSRCNLAALYHVQGKYAQAEPLYLESLRQSELKRGPDHPDSLSFKFNLAALYHDQMKYDKSETLTLEVLRQRVKTLGPDHLDTLVSKHALAKMYWTQEKYDKAEPLFLEVLPKREKRLGADHPDTLTSKDDLAGLYWALGKYAQSETLCLEVVRQREKKLGPDHPHTLRSKSNLATLYQAQRKFDQAELLGLEVLRQREKRLGADHPDTLTSKNDLAELYKNQGKYDKAEPLFQQATDGAIKTLTFTHPVTRRYLQGLADFHDQMGKPEKAQSVLQRHLDFLQARKGSDPTVTAGVMAQLGSTLLRQKKYGEAELALRECLTLREKIGPDVWTTFNTKSLLGEALLGQRKYPDAEPLLVQGYEGLAKHAAKMPPQSRVIRLKEALERLVRLHEVSGNKDEAAKWRMKLDETTKSNAKKIGP